MGEPAGVQVGLFEHQPHADVTTYATLGLSDHVLEMAGGRTVRQELLLAVHLRLATADLSKLLFFVAESVIKNHRALLRGEVFSLGHPIAPGATCCHLYVSLPVVFPEALATYTMSDPSTVCAWLMPITSAERQAITDRGWSAFEDMLERAEVDLFDLARSSVA